MDLRNILIGCVKRVGSKAEGLSVFKNTIGIAGVVWNSPIELPVLSIEQQQLLSRTHIAWNAKDGNSLIHDNEWSEVLLNAGTDDALKPYFDMAARDIALVNQFKDDVPKRKHFFLQGPEVEVKAHFDAKASNLYAHRHLFGNGLRIFYPTEGHEFEATIGPHSRNVIPSFKVADLIEKGCIASFDLQPNDIIVFNHKLLHASNSGDRFRTAVNGYGREL